MSPWRVGRGNTVTNMINEHKMRSSPGREEREGLWQTLLLLQYIYLYKGAYRLIKKINKSRA